MSPKSHSGMAALFVPALVPFCVNQCWRDKALPAPPAGEQGSLRVNQTSQEIPSFRKYRGTTIDLWRFHVPLCGDTSTV